MNNNKLGRVTYKFLPVISCHYHPRQSTQLICFQAFWCQLPWSKRRILNHKTVHIATWLEQRRLILLTIFSAWVRRVVLPHPGAEYMTTVGLNLRIESKKWISGLEQTLPAAPVKVWSKEQRRTIQPRALHLLLSRDRQGLILRWRGGLKCSSTGVPSF